MSMQKSDQWDQVSAVRPISDDFWKEFSIEFSYIMWAANLGMDIQTAHKTRYLARKVITYAYINQKSMDGEAKELIAFIKKCLVTLNWGLYSCIDLEKRKIGLSHLKQISIYPTMSGEFGVVCVGFTEPLGMEIYFNLRNIASEFTMPTVAMIHGAFHTLLTTKKQELPDSFSLTPSVSID